MNKSKVIQSARQVLNIEALAIKNLAKKLDNNFYKVVNLINSLKGKLIISGVGKSGNIAPKIAASLPLRNTCTFLTVSSWRYKYY